MTRINTNLAALVAIQNLNNSHNQLNTSLGRLSTGFRINRASDDPAGLVISDKLRSQIASLQQAVDNTQRSQNMVSTADGALNEVENLLVSIKGLTVQAANDGAMSSSEIAANQAQVDSAIDSINRISNATSFAGKKLLDGSIDYVTSGVAASIQQLNIYTAQFGTNSQMAVTLKMTQSARLASVSRVGKGTSAGSAITLQITGNKGTEIITVGASTANSGIQAAVNALSDSTGVSALQSANLLVFYSTTLGSSQFVSVKDLDTDGNGVTWVNARASGRDATATINGSKAIADGDTLTVNALTLKARFLLKPGLNKNVATTTFFIKSGGLNFQLGDTTVTSQKQALGIQQTQAINLGDASVGFLNQIATGGTFDLHTNANTAAKIVDAAINSVTALRGRLGAFVKNTLETNANSLGVAIENTDASESRIRDVDFAAETANFTREQVLVQAGTSILAQANLVPQSVLTLLGK